MMPSLPSSSVAWGVPALCDAGEDDATALDALNQFVSGLETAGKRKASDEDEKLEKVEELGQAKKRKRLLRDRTEGGVENEFSASAGGTSTNIMLTCLTFVLTSTEGPSKLSLDDLLKPLASKQDALASLKKAVKPLADPSNPKNQPLPAPLPTRTQERLEREAAYEQTKQEVDKWTDTMKRIQEVNFRSYAPIGRKAYIPAKG